MNRYTQLSTTQFNPLSIEELSIVPMAMRQKHDQATAQLEERRTALNTFGESLPHHQERAHSLIQQMNSAIDKESEQLNNNGYTRTTGSNIIKLNRDYQNLMAPNGELGKIASAKKTYSENYKQYVEDGQKKGWGLDKIQNGWANHAKNYFGYDEEGNVSTIGQAGAPEKYELTDALKTYAPHIGQIKRRLDSMGGGNIVPGPDGMLMIIDKSGSVHQLTNSPQLQQLNALLMSEFLTPGGKGYESAMYAGKDLQTLKNEIGATVAMMTKDEITDTTSISRSLVKRPGSEGGGPGSGLNTPGISPFLAVGSSFHTGNLSSISSKSDVVAELNRLKDGTSDQSIRKKRELEGLTQRAELSLKNNQDYQHTLRARDAEQRRLTSTGLLGENSSKANRDANSILRTGINELPGQRGVIDNVKSSARLKTLNDRILEYESNAYKVAAMEKSNYTLAPSGVAKIDKFAEAVTGSIPRVLKSSRFGVGNDFDVVGILTDDGERVLDGISSGDKKAVEDLIRSVPESQIQFNIVSPKGMSGGVEYEVTIHTNKGQVGDTDGVIWGMNKIGDGKPVTLRLKANTLTNNQGVKTLNTHTAQYFAAMGDTKGLELANAIVNNTHTENFANNLY